MRLLKYKANREPEIISFDDDTTPPPYAILSHTWGGDADELTFTDIVSGNGTAKHGYNKIRFCGDQAQQDGLQYFWVDTCCIDKTDRAELSHAIQSMFIWYQNATKCYVYLSDVSTRKRKLIDTQHIECTWESAFRSSRWFTRGWTLQELLAPSVVEFFSQEWDRLGDKTLLGPLIRKITGISQDVLNGLPLSQSSINDRLRWTDGRETKHEEDKTYSLLGIFGVELAPMYGEGAASAFKRLLNEIDNLKRCVQDLHSTNPRDDKERIEETKGGLLVDSYRWVLSNITFQQWRQDGQMLWVKGDPGKGKTMLLCGIIDELHGLLQHTALIAYFFCQATDSRINSATAVLRGLLYMLVTQQPILAVQVRKRYDQAGKNLFEDANAWVALTGIFVDVLRDPRLKPVYLIIDALDECVTDMSKLLDLIVKQSSVSSRIKWIVSSRNWPEIEEQLEQSEQNVRLSLELNAESVATGVSIFIQHKVSRLAQQKKYDRQTQDIVVNYLTSNSNDTYLWVGLVCQELQTTARRNVLKKLESFPPGLNALYEQMMHQISKADDAELCRQVLASLALVYRPVTLEELITLVEQLEDIVDVSELEGIIGQCGSFLTLREQTVYFVHQSAKDFLLAKAAEEVFPKGKEYVMHGLLVRSLQTMTTTLERDIYGLGALGYTLDDDFEAPDLDPLASSRYSCIYWIDHLYDLSLAASTTFAEPLQDEGIIESFLRSRLLYWLEALSLCKSMSKGVVSIGKLHKMVQARGGTTPFIDFVYDIHRFVMYHKQTIERSPLQAYASALLFSPQQSLTKRLFQHEEPAGITVKSPMGDDWSACLQTLEGHSDAVYLVTFSRDSTRLASASWDGTAKIWDANSGACLQTLDVDTDFSRLAFSLDMTRMASSSDRDVKIWDTSNGACLQTLTGHDNAVVSVTFSHDSKWVASASQGDTIKIWDVNSGTCLQTLTGAIHIGPESKMALSYDSTRLVSSSDRDLMIWDTSNGICLRTLTGHDNDILSVTFSHDSKWVASASRGDTIKIWDVNSGTCLQTLDGYSGRIISVTFSHNSNCLASASDDGTVQIWDGDSGACLYTLEGHSDQVTSIAFSYDSNWLASASNDNTIKVWDLGSGASSKTVQDHSHTVRSITFSHDFTQVASSSRDKTVKIWDMNSGLCVRTFGGHSSVVDLVVFSRNSARLASISRDGVIKIWDVGSSTCMQTIRGLGLGLYSIISSPDSTRLASASLLQGIVQIWDISSRDCLQEFLLDDSNKTRAGAFSHDSNKLASASSTYAWSNQTPSNSLTAGSLSPQRELEHSIKIWDVGNGTCLQTMDNQNECAHSITFSHDSSRLAAAFGENNVKVFDVNSGVCLQTLSVDRRITSLSFDYTGSCLHTNVGTIAIDSSETSSLVGLAETKPCQWQGVGISSDGMWITNGDQNILRIPPEYRGDCSCVGGNMVAIGTGSGKVWICSVDLPSAPI